MTSTKGFLSLPGWQDGIFGVVHVMNSSKDEEKTDKFSLGGARWNFCFKCFLEFIQFVPLVMNSQNVFACTGGAVHCVLDIVSSPFKVVSTGTTWQYYVTTFFLIFLIMLAAVSCAIVYISSKRRDFQLIWPLIVLRGFAGIILITFFNDVVGIMIATYSCAMLQSRAGSTFECYNSLHWVTIILSILCLCFLVPFGMLIGLIFDKFEFFRRVPGVQAHGRVEIWFLVYKVLMSAQYVLAYTFSDLLIWCQVVTFFSTLALASSQILRCPFFRDLDNQIRSGILVSLLFLSGLSIVESIIYWDVPADATLLYTFHIDAGYYLLLGVVGWSVGWEMALVRRYVINDLMMKYYNLSTALFPDFYLDGLKEILSSLTTLDPSSKTNQEEFRKFNDSHNNFKVVINEENDISKEPLNSEIVYNKIHPLNSSTTSSMSSNIEEKEIHKDNWISDGNQNVKFSTLDNETKTFRQNPSNPQKIFFQSPNFNRTNNSADDLYKIDSGVYSENIHHNENTEISSTGNSTGYISSENRVCLFSSSKTFMSIRENIFFETDLELFLRAFIDCWQEFSESQKHVATAIMTEIFVALFRLPNPPAFIYIWYAMLMRTIQSDLAIAVQFISLGVYARGESDIDTRYLCFMLQKEIESIKDNSLLRGGNKSKGRANLVEIAIFKKWIVESDQGHKISVSFLSDLLKILISDDHKANADNYNNNIIQGNLNSNSNNSKRMQLQNSQRKNDETEHLPLIHPDRNRSMNNSDRFATSSINNYSSSTNRPLDFHLLSREGIKLRRKLLSRALDALMKTESAICTLVSRFPQSEEARKLRSAFYKNFFFESKVEMTTASIENANQDDLDSNSDAGLSNSTQVPPHISELSESTQLIKTSAMILRILVVVSAVCVAAVILVSNILHFNALTTALDSISVFTTYSASVWLPSYACTMLNVINIRLNEETSSTPYLSGLSLLDDLQSLVLSEASSSTSPRPIIDAASVLSLCASAMTTLQADSTLKNMVLGCGSFGATASDDSRSATHVYLDFMSSSNPLDDGVLTYSSVPNIDGVRANISTFEYLPLDDLQSTDKGYEWWPLPDDIRSDALLKAYTTRELTPNVNNTISPIYQSQSRFGIVNCRTLARVVEYRGTTLGILFVEVMGYRTLDDSILEGYRSYRSNMNITSILQQKTQSLDDGPINDVFYNKIFMAPHVDEDTLDVQFVEAKGMSLLSLINIHLEQSLLFARMINMDAFINSPSTRTMFELCSHANANIGASLIDAQVEFNNDLIDKAYRILSIFLVIIAVLIFFSVVFTVYGIRHKLHHLDRIDGTSVALELIASLPTNVKDEMHLRLLSSSSLVDDSVEVNLNDLMNEKSKSILASDWTNKQKKRLKEGISHSINHQYSNHTPYQSINQTTNQGTTSNRNSSVLNHSAFINHHLALEPDSPTQPPLSNLIPKKPSRTTSFSFSIRKVVSDEILSKNNAFRSHSLSSQKGQEPKHTNSIFDITLPTASKCEVQNELYLDGDTTNNFTDTDDYDSALPHLHNDKIPKPVISSRASSTRLAFPPNMIQSVRTISKTPSQSRRTQSSFYYQAKSKETINIFGICKNALKNSFNIMISSRISRWVILFWILIAFVAAAQLISSAQIIIALRSVQTATKNSVRAQLVLVEATKFMFDLIDPTFLSFRKATLDSSGLSPNENAKLLINNVYMPDIDNYLLNLQDKASLAFPSGHITSNDAIASRGSERRSEIFYGCQRGLTTGKKSIESTLNNIIDSYDNQEYRDISLTGSRSFPTSQYRKYLFEYETSTCQEQEEIFTMGEIFTAVFPSLTFLFQELLGFVDIWSVRAASIEASGGDYITIDEPFDFWMSILLRIRHNLIPGLILSANTYTSDAVDELDSTKNIMFWYRVIVVGATLIGLIFLEIILYSASTELDHLLLVARMMPKKLVPLNTVLQKFMYGSANVDEVEDEEESTIMERPSMIDQSEKMRSSII